MDEHRKALSPVLSFSPSGQSLSHRSAAITGSVSLSASVEGEGNRVKKGWSFGGMPCKKWMRGRLRMAPNSMSNWCQLRVGGVAYGYGGSGGGAVGVPPVCGVVDESRNGTCPSCGLAHCRQLGF